MYSLEKVDQFLKGHREIDPVDASDIWQRAETASQGGMIKEEQIKDVMGPYADAFI